MNKQLLQHGLMLAFFLSFLTLTANNSPDSIPKDILGGLKFRNLTPAFVSGRVGDFAVNPKNISEYYVAVASGHIWKTENNGTTFAPVFENYGVYSIGCLAMDPNNSNVVWAGTGENNHQRSVSYGNGVYKTLDGGKSWTKMGLENSMQIGMIQIDPRNSDVVYVAAEGSVWGPGGDRGLYKTTDGGKNWEKILSISDHTGVNNVVLSPDNADIIYASSEQRRRHPQIRIGGGPESEIFKSVDAGKSWKKLTSGIPAVHKGGMSIAVSPVDPNYVYIMIEAQFDKGGLFRSVDRGESFQKMSDYNASGQYFGEIFCDPVRKDVIYALDVVSKISLDGGKNWQALGLKNRHVDDHALWIDPANIAHFMIGGDGGIYETFDGGQNYIQKTNLPVTQFYRVSTDNAFPFYNVYGGTQDNSSLGAPSSTIYAEGISRGDWTITLGGDGFWQAVDPEDPDIIYSEYQYGNAYRFDKKSGERTNIKPRERAGEVTYKWNWNTPMILSKHNNKRLYMAANKIFRSNDRGDSWEVLTDDITRGIHRDHWPVMDRYWSIDAVAKNMSTSLFGMAVSLDESPLNEQILVAGTDDGVVQITSDGGKTWKKLEQFPGVPEFTYISDVLTSRHDENTIYVCFDNKKRNDLKPYVLKSDDLGLTWTNITSNLPVNSPVITLNQDHKMADLLFAGTESGVFFSADGGVNWIQLKAGLPSIAVYDIAIQERENDLVLATFGRGFYILDDYAPLRNLTPDILQKQGHLFDVKDALHYIQARRGGYGFGSMEYFSENRTYGAIFTYYLNNIPKTLKELRQEKEKKLFEEKAPIPIPSMEALMDEEKEIPPVLLFTVKDEAGEIVNSWKVAPQKGINRQSWNLRYPSVAPVSSGKNKFDPLENRQNGLMAFPGKYTVQMALQFRDSTWFESEPRGFNLVPIFGKATDASQKQATLAFRKKAEKMAATIQSAHLLTDKLTVELNQVWQTVHATEQAQGSLVKLIESSLRTLDEIKWDLSGEIPKASPEERIPAKVTMDDRIDAIFSVFGQSGTGITKTQLDMMMILENEIPGILNKLERIADKDMVEIGIMLDAIQAPWTPGRIPKWKVD